MHFCIYITGIEKFFPARLEPASNFRSQHDTVLLLKLACTARQYKCAVQFLHTPCDILPDQIGLPPLKFQAIEYNKLGEIVHGVIGWIHVGRFVVRFFLIKSLFDS